MGDSATLVAVYGSLKKYMEEPFKTFRFVVFVENALFGAFAQFSGIKTEVETVPVRPGNDYRGVQEFIPVFTKYEPVTLTRGVLADDDSMFDWITSSAANDYTGPSGDSVYRTIEVLALNDAGDKAVMWTLKNAMPIRYEVAPLDAMHSDVLTESVTFSIQGVKREAKAIKILDIGKLLSALFGVEL